MKLNKISIFILGMLVWSSMGCENKDPLEEPCNPEIISETDHFKVPVKLTNRCTKEGAVDYIIKAANIYGDYAVEGELIIEPGTTIQFEAGAGLAVDGTGSITAEGTASQPITLMGENSNDIGSWKGVYIGSNNVKNRLEYVTIKGGGSEEFNSNGEKANIVLYAGGKVAINNCIIENSAAFGINSNYTDGEITSCMGNAFNNNETPMLIRANNIHEIDASNTFSGNNNSYVYCIVGDDITDNKIWQAISIPYRFYASSGGLFPFQYVDNSGQLTINAGATLEFESGTGLAIYDNASLIAKGTASNPITFTGSSKVAGFWSGLYFRETQSPLNEIAHAVIEYASSDDGAITLSIHPKLNVNNTTFKDISNCAFYDERAGVNPNLTRTDLTYTNVGNQYCN